MGRIEHMNDLCASLAAGRERRWAAIMSLHAHAQQTAAERINQRQERRERLQERLLAAGMDLRQRVAELLAILGQERATQHELWVATANSR